METFVRNLQGRALVFEGVDAFAARGTRFLEGGVFVAESRVFGTEVWDFGLLFGFGRGSGWGWHFVLLIWFGLNEALVRYRVLYSVAK